MSAAAPQGTSFGPQGTSPGERAALHATTIVVGEAAIVLRGPSGAGKTALALALIEAARRLGLFARLVADDRTLAREAGGRLIVAPHPRIAGRVERRFQGLGAAEHEGAAVARLVVDLHPHWDSPGVERLPAEAPFATIAGVRLPRLGLPASHRGCVDTILHAVRNAAP